MYDARGKSSDQSGLFFGILIIAVVGLAFFGVLMMPQKSDAANIAADETNQSNVELLAALDDRSTQTYVATLNRLSPRSAQRLEKDVSRAIKNGANKDELADLVMQSVMTELISNSQHLARADVKHLDALLNLSESGLRTMSRSNSKWCKGAHYERLIGSSPQAMQYMVQENFGYSSPAYDWGIQFNTVMLEAIADSKANPQTYGKITSADERRLQRLAMTLVSNPEIMKLAAIQGGNKAATQRAIRGLNFCSLAVTGIDAVQGLPKDTRGRLWAEGFRQMDNGELEKAMSQMNAF